jgi:hypothetical protein
MPLIEEITNQNNQKESTNQSDSINQPKQNSLITTFGSLLPFAPLLFEQFTGQKIPQMSGTIAEIQTALISIQSGMQTLVNNQNQI